MNICQEGWSSKVKPGMKKLLQQHCRALNNTLILNNTSQNTIYLTNTYWVCVVFCVAQKTLLFKISRKALQLLVPFLTAEKKSKIKSKHRNSPRKTRQIVMKKFEN